MNTKEFLSIVCKKIKYKPASKVISEELEAHIEDAKTENLCKGYPEQEAEERAVGQMGDADEIGKKLNKIHKPKLDWITLIFIIAFVLYGRNFWILYYHEGLWNYETSYWRIHYRLEYIGIILGILFGAFLYFYDYRKICKHSKFLFIFATGLNIIAYIRGFRANGNLVYGLYPFTQTSPTVLSIPLYIISFAGFIKDTKNMVKLIILSFIAVITSLMINFASGFLVVTVYLIISVRELLKKKHIKTTFILIGTTIILFSLLSIIICIIPTRHTHSEDKYTSPYWVGIDTVGERRIDFVRKEIFKSAKLFGQADLEGIQLKDEQGYMSSIKNYFGTSGIFAFLGVLSNYGWVASFGLVAILLIFSIKLIMSSIKIKDTYGKLIVIGISTFFITQIICNLAMNFGIIGVAEFDLPLISGGKSTLIANVLCMALFLSVYRRKDINFEEPKKSKILISIENFLFEECEESELQ